MTSTRPERARALHLISLAVATALASAATMPAHAQDEQEAPKPAAGATELQEVVVTGSRIARPDLASDSPTVSVSSDVLKNTSQVSIDQQLLKMPQFVAGSNQTINAGDIQATPTNSPGIATANLRGLGANRTLVLLDGRRTQPANASMVVDLNTIPTAALDGVEIITGGAGSTYGADAVAGVVNFKLKTNFQGITVDAQTGQSFRGDGNQTQVSALLGSNFADDRGNSMIAITYAKRDPVYARNRPFYSAVYDDPNSGNSGGFPNFSGFVGTGSQTAINSAFSSYAPGDVTPSQTLYFNTAPTTQGASLFSVNPGAVSGAAAPGYTGPLSPSNKLLTNGALVSNNTNNLISLPMERYSLFAHTRYDLNDNAQVYMQATFDQNQTNTNSGASAPAVNQWAITVPYNPAYDDPSSPTFMNGPTGTAYHPVPAALAQILNSRAAPGTPWTLNSVLTNLGPETLDTSTTTYELLAGVKGKLGLGDWTYDVYASHGDTSQQVQIGGIADILAYQTLMNQTNYGAGADYNNGRTGLLAHCTSGINPFLNTGYSADCAQILASPLKTLTGITQNQAEVDFQGAVVPLPAGDLRLAVGADYRTDQFNYEPDRGISAQNITSGGVGLFGTNTTVGSIRVKEGYIEALVPVLKNMPFVKALNLDGGFRHSDYDTGAGGVNTWKLTGDWDLNEWVKIRGGRQVANRAPNVAELFTPGVVTTVSWPDADPCSILTRATYGNVASNPNRAKVQALCSALSGGFPIGNNYIGNQPVYFGYGRDLTTGNPNVQSETAKTWTGGVVLRSPFTSIDALRKLTLTVDFYSITVDGAISPVSTPTVYQQCLNALGTNPNYDPNNAYCKLIVRSNVNGFWLYTKALYSNLGLISTKGVDTQLDWNTSTAFGTFYANVNFNYLNSFKVQTNAQSPVLDYSNSINGPYGAQFRYKLYTTLGYGIGPVLANLAWRHLPSVENAALVTSPTSTTLPTASYDLFDLSGRWTVNSMLEVRLGIDNLFNKQPNIVGTIPGTSDNVGITDSGSYDVIGRSWYLGVSARF